MLWYKGKGFEKWQEKGRIMNCQYGNMGFITYVASCLVKSRNRKQKQASVHKS